MEWQWVSKVFDLESSVFFHKGHSVGSLKSEFAHNYPPALLLGAESAGHLYTG